jgi:hypothetical protein
MPRSLSSIPSPDAAWIERRIYIVRGVKVLLDSDLAVLYGVPTKRLNEQVRRNRRRFPADFLLELTAEETTHLRSQIATSSSIDGSTSSTAGHGGRRFNPLAFTEQGVAMLSSVLHSDRAIDVNIAVMRAFVRLRHMPIGHAELAKKVDELEQRYDGQFQVVFDALRELMIAPEPLRPRIGFDEPSATR